MIAELYSRVQFIDSTIAIHRRMVNKKYCHVVLRRE